MDITNWCILASVLLVSANAGRYDLGPQYFYESSSPAPQAVPNFGTKDIVLYLTPRQVQALEASGAVLRPQEEDSAQLYPDETEQDQEEEEQSEQSNDKTEDENLGDQKPKEVSELEEIFRILNKQIEEDAKRVYGDSNSGQVSQTQYGQEQGDENKEEEQEEEKQGEEQDEGQQEEKQIGNFREIPSRFGVLQKYRVEKLLESLISKKQNQQQKENNIGSISYQRKSNRFQEEEVKKSEIDRDSIEEIRNRLQDKYKVIPVEEESQEGNKQKIEVDLRQEQLLELLRPILEQNKIVQSIAHRRGQLVQNELQLYKGLQELKAAPKDHHQKYATEIERLRANLEAQNALTRAEAIAKATRVSPKEEFNKNSYQLDNDNRESLTSRLRSALALRRSQQFAPLEVSTPIPVPISKRSRIEINTPKSIKPARRAPASARNKFS